ncbi:hypothetical protein LX15_000877 [Streptoalloteichus tenebrarius]|uniref:Secreted protein n=1 Tax=Streptoalloteichus tenebrarius (strain ATCC 17920 / DSM 40477 / JCM 4838 / CBS 697.72 / NBRC 16177 / NCIMB 11028 / NRRL B-12390 / A12253. 1 / ISP 5477) TaxID=1933 RepID=A0ABT1HNV7_STRSD|nr:hypothetical protein [Streptoalloteichus tenebrarius]MCP2257192.1 hypothetical protein [Streptoalloteichus tenebrarius]BFE98825.1 hypothetical protein GCM10020241_05010 [Streptoalloteichus tenebrarius]
MRSSWRFLVVAAVGAVTGLLGAGPALAGGDHPSECRGGFVYSDRSHSHHREVGSWAYCGGTRYDYRAVVRCTDGEYYTGPWRHAGSEDSVAWCPGPTSATDWFVETYWVSHH